MKTNAIVRIIVFSLAILILLGILLGVLCFNIFLIDGKLQFDHDVRVEEPVAFIEQDGISAQVRNIEIEWVAGSITIQPDESIHEIQVTEYSRASSEHQTVMKQSGQTLKIQFCEESMKFPSFGINVDVSKELVILVPSDWACNTLEIDAASAEVEIHDLQINELDFDGASGQLTLDNCNIVELDIDTASGDVQFSGILKELDFDAASAKFDGEFYQIPDHLNMDTMSGDLEIVLPEYCGFEMEYDTMSGSFGSDFEFTTNGSIYKCGDGACKIKVSAMSGDVNILKGIQAPTTSAGQNCTH